jgi:hypothetical protein
MKYYITMPEIAKGASAIKAEQMGCSGVTSFWWNVINHPTNGQAAICFSDEECALNPPETVKILYKNPPDAPTLTITTNDLSTHAFLDAAGWFPAPEEF